MIKSLNKHSQKHREHLLGDQQYRKLQPISIRHQRSVGHPCWNQPDHRETMDLVGLSTGLQTLNRYTPDTAIHRGGKILTDMATMIAVGGDCPQDIDLLRTATGQHPLFGQMASPPTEVRFVEALASTAPASAVTDSMAAVKSARTQA